MLTATLLDEHSVHLEIEMQSSDIIVLEAESFRLMSVLKKGHLKLLKGSNAIQGICEKFWIDIIRDRYN